MYGAKLLLIIIIILMSSMTQAQTDVIVTTRQPASLRAEPNPQSERLAVIPVGISLSALNRGTGTRWIRVEYEGRIGWVAYWLLDWQGDIFAVSEFAPPRPHSETGVYVTTNDFSSLRIGPGIHWDRITVIPPNVTLAAIGRSPSARWLQVEYEGQTGWIIYWLLTESGPVFDLPVDGINPLPFIRLGTGDKPRDTGFRSVDTSNEWAFSHPYSWLLAPLYDEIGQGQASLQAITNIWRTLAQGNATSCRHIPTYVEHTDFPERSRNLELVFMPSVTALNHATTALNNAIALFEDTCLRTDSFITIREVYTAIEQLDIARRNYTLAESLLDTLEDRFN